MKTLKLLTKPAILEDIISGKKKEERRIITPSLQSKFVTVSETEVILNIYDAIEFVAGHEENVPSAIVKVEKTEIEYEADEDGYIKLIEDNNKLYLEDAEVIYQLGEIIFTKNIN